MEGARDYRREDETEETTEIVEKAKGQVSRFAGRAQQAARDVRQRIGGERTEEHQEKLSDQLRRGSQETKELGRDAADVAAEVGTLLKQEMQLARAEMAKQASLVVQLLTWGTGAALFAMLMLIFLFVGVMLAIGLALELWVAAFITTGILAVLAMIAGLVAYQRMKQVRLVPEQTMESVKEDIEWARNQMTSSSR